MSTRLGGRYQIVREIGAGGMGRVFQAVDTETGRPVAAKVMIGSGDELEPLLRFQQEGAVLSTLKHPNIVEVYGTFLEEHTSCIIMELLEGLSLKDILRAERLSLPRIKHLLEQVSSALAYAHGRAIVHRDIKPDNIMVVGNDHVKVTDFGIARILRTGSTLNTATGMSIGTPLYMAPEQIEGQKVDGRADIYSFGAVIYQMVTGRPPFDGEDPLTVAFKHVHKAPQPPSEVNADVPADWEALILKCLAKDPADRYQTTAALAEAISTLQLPGDAPVVADVPAPPVNPPRPQPRTEPDTVDRILNPERTGPPAQTRIATKTPPPVAAPDVHTRPAENFDTRVRPVEAPATILRPAVAADVTSRPRARPQSHDPVTAHPTAQATPVAVEPHTLVQHEKSGPPIPAILGGAIATLAAIAAVVFFVFKPGSSSGKAAPVHHTVASAAVAPALIATIASRMASGGTAHLAWSSVARATKYRLQIATAPGDPSDAIVFKNLLLVRTLSGTRFPLHVVGPQYYYWRVQARIAGTWSKYSASKHFGVTKPVVGRPSPLSPSNGTAKLTLAMRLCWSPVKGAVGYQVKLNGRTLTARSTCRFVKVQPGTYSWRVAAKVKGTRVFTGAYSDVARFRINKKVHTSKPKPSRPAATAAPVAPVQPVAPAPPVAPVQPVATAAPVAPVQPVATAAPVAPVQPVAPAPPVKKPACSGESC